MTEYELLRASNRVKVLEEELRLASGGSVLNAAISSLFQLSEAVVLPDRSLSVSLVANGQAGEPEAFCTAGAVHVFHIGLYALSSLSPIGAGLVASCPQTAGLAKHETVEGLHVPETPTSMRVCAMIELFNTRSLELNSSGTAGCSRLSTMVGMDLMPNACVNLTTQPVQSSAREACRHLSERTPGYWDVASGWHPLGCNQASSARIHSSFHPELRWMRVIGDSITWNLMGSLKQAFAGSEKWLATQELKRVQAKKPVLICQCTESGRCLSFESWYSMGGTPRIPLHNVRDLSAFVQNISGIYQPVPSAIYISLGSHDVLGGGDSVYMRGLEAGFLHFLERMLSIGSPSAVLLATTTAIGMQMPNKIVHIRTQRCRMTNYRVLKRNEAASRAFFSACNSQRIANACRVVDLFSPTLPWIKASDRCYKQADPIHFQGFLRRRADLWAGRLVTGALHAALCDAKPYLNHTVCLAESRRR